MRAVTRFVPHFALAALALGCVPTDDPPAPAQTGVAALPAPPPPPPASAVPRGRLDPGRPLASANPFVPSGDAGAAKRLPRRGDQRRLTAPGLEVERAPAALAKSPNLLPELAPPPSPALAQPPVEPAAPAAAAEPAAVPAAAAKAPAGPPDSPIVGVYYDSFDRAELGPEWNATSSEWRIVAGRLCGQRARNHPAWLRRKLPVNARIEFDATSTSPDGDLKVEIWGDGKSFAKGTSYTDATSYLAIFGGWKNQFHVLARIDEHAPGRPEVKVTAGGDLKARPVVANTAYHFKLERLDGKTVRWFVDDIEVLSFEDPKPMKGEGHEHLGFNDWEVQVCFDNLQITALTGA